MKQENAPARRKFLINFSREAACEIYEEVFHISTRDADEIIIKNRSPEALS